MFAKKRGMILISTVVAAILLGAGLAVAKATFTEFSGYAYMSAAPSGGDLKCIGGTPMPPGSWPPCTAGSRAQIRGLNLTYRQESPDPLHRGIREAVLNMNFDENGRARSWGTWRLVLDDGKGTWEGTFTGSSEGWFGAGETQILGHGTEGEVDGMQLRGVVSNEVFPGPDTFSGFRLDPKGSK